MFVYLVYTIEAQKLTWTEILILWREEEKIMDIYKVNFFSLW